MDKDLFIAEVVEFVDKYFPKGQCKERGEAMVLVADIVRLLNDRGILYGNRYDPDSGVLVD